VTTLPTGAVAVEELTGEIDVTLFGRKIQIKTGSRFLRVDTKV